MVEKRNWIQTDGKRNWMKDWKSCTDYEEHVAEIHDMARYWLEMSAKLAVRLFVEGVMSRAEIAEIFGMSTASALKILHQFMDKD